MTTQRTPNPLVSAPRRFPAPVLFAAAVALAVSGCNCGLVAVQGSSCTVDEDCAANPSCARIQGGCKCQSRTCYYDPSAPPADETQGCRTCHGSLDNAAPPRSVAGSTSTTEIGVGAHQTHLNGGKNSRPVSCSECHLVPTSVGDPGHIDSPLPAEVIFGSLANASEIAANWDRTTATCNTYCHGKSLPGGKHTTPTWTKVDGTEAACGSCHGLPPPPPHPFATDNCDQCHAPTAGPNLTIANRNTHVDGVVQGAGGACDSCHGDPTRDPLISPAPPKDLKHNTASTKVGAHLKHLTAANSVDVTCDSCHKVPKTVGDPGHIDDGDNIAELTFGGLSRTDGSTPSYDFATQRCSSSYCHGYTLTGGANNNQVLWTDSASQAQCNACHGNPPPRPHIQRDDCGTCHPGYSKTGATTGTTDKALHVNGKIDTGNLSCSLCHGTAGRTGADPQIAAAPPQGTQGETDPSTRAVGAHLKHLQGGAVTNPIACDECHTRVANGELTSGLPHINGVSDLPFGPVATTGRLSPTFDGANCSSTWCHGNFKNGNRSNAPSWTGGAGQATCGTCHGAAGLPAALSFPAGTHPRVTAATDCGQCHPGYTQTSVDKSKHINGQIDLANMTCTDCHGSAGRVGVAGADPNQAAAPPIDTAGLSDVTLVSVGAHQAHVNPASPTLSNPIACTQCHPDHSGNFAHANLTVDVPFGTGTPLAIANGSNPSWSHASGSCSGVWCHGGNAKLGSKPSISWNTGATVDCTSCHGNPPARPHPQRDDCATCHGAGYSKTGATSGTVVANTHVDGTIDVLSTVTCTECHGTAGRSIDPTLSAAPPTGTLGETATTTRAVGAHQAHLNAGALSAAFACTSCHNPVPAGAAGISHEDGVAQVVFGGIATANNSVPAWNGTGCSATYCHSGLKNGNAANQPNWTGDTTQVSCNGSCHGSASSPMPGGTHPKATAGSCGNCHTGYTETTVNTALHVNGTVDIVNMNCADCHGTVGRVGVAGADPNQAGAPPRSVSQSIDPTTVGVGAHQAHVNPTAPAMAAPLQCIQCHPDHTGDFAHATGGSPIVAFSATSVAASNGSIPTAWSQATATCANTWCHGGNAKLGSMPAVSWITGSKVDCTSCHGLPPPPPHVQNPDCGHCHTGYSYTNATTWTVNAATHVNGKIDYVAPTCTLCHGTTAARTGVDPNVSAAPPTDSTGSSTSPAVGAHLAHLTGGPLTNGLPCSSCHTVPTTQLHATGIISVPFPPGSLATAGNVTPTFSNGSCASTYCHGNFRNGNPANAPSWAGGPAQAACGSCHGDPATGDPTPKTDPAGTHPVVDATLDCGDCHAGYTRTTVNKNLHVNGHFDGGGEPSKGKMACSGCHNEIVANTASNSIKATRHLVMSDSPTDPGGSWITGADLKTSPMYASATNSTCLSACHGDHPHTLSGTATHQFNVHEDANNRSATASSTARSNTDFDPNSATGGLCLSCHTLPVDAAHPALSIASYGASAHDYTTFLTYGAWSYTLHDGSAFMRNCTKCHADPADGRPAASTSPFGAVHYSDNASLLSGPAVANGALASLQCFQCHGSASVGQDLSGKSMAPLFAKAGRHRVDTDSVHNSVTEASPAYGTALGGAARHVNCLDCHDPHQAQAGAHSVPGNLAGPAVRGAIGVPLTSNPAFWTASASGNFGAPKAMAAGDNEANLCLKCHSSFFWGATAPADTYVTGTAAFTAGSATVTGTGTSWTAAQAGWLIKSNPAGLWYTVLSVQSPTSLTLSRTAAASASGAYTMQVYRTDVAKEFNPANTTSGASLGSFHPVFASAGSNRGAVNLTNLVTTAYNWSTSVRNTMTCSDCHDSDTPADPNGPHGSSAAFILRGPNTRWDSSLINGSSMPAGTFCANCHSPTWVGSRFPDHVKGDHRIPCLNCHSANAHGGPRVGMLNPMAGTALTDSFADYDNAAPYARPDPTKDRLYIKSYPSTATATWREANCGCNGTSH